MKDDFEAEMKALRKRTAQMEERARLAAAQASIARSNLEHHKFVHELADLKKAKKK